ncbi:MAG TPA: hypothetical protein VGD99_14410 [Anaerolineae bacterium]
MKNDKFLLGIVAGIVLLVMVAVTVVLTRGGQEDYIAADTPAGVVHNYYLAIQRRDYERAYGYLSDDLEAKPELDDFMRTVDAPGNQAESSIQIGETTLDDDRAQVDVAITTYYGGGLFNSGNNTTRQTAYLRATAGGDWRLIEFPYPYWGYDWNQARD